MTNRIKHKFAVEIEELKIAYRAQIEVLKAESARWLQDNAANLELKKAPALKAVQIRAEKFPLMTSSLRTMKNTIEALHGLAEELGGDRTIPLTGSAKHARQARDCVQSLETITALFEETLSQVRLFIKRSDFYLPGIAKTLCKKWGKEGRVSISIDDYLNVRHKYGEDIGYFTAEFFMGWEYGRVLNPAEKDLRLEAFNEKMRRAGIGLRLPEESDS